MSDSRVNFAPRLRARERVVVHVDSPAARWIGALAVLSLFGMMNWIYTWHNPRVDADAKELADQMGNIFLKGISAAKAGKNGRRAN